jgi:hypothetical protein
MLSHEAEVGVNRTWKRLCFSSQRFILVRETAWLHPAVRAAFFFVLNHYILYAAVNNALKRSLDAGASFLDGNGIYPERAKGFAFPRAAFRLSEECCPDLP